MKLLFIVLLFAATGCSTPKSGNVTVTQRPPATESRDLVERTRFPETVAVYHVARHADPGHPLLMHEAHAVYRVEGKAAWDLRAPLGLFALPYENRMLTNVAHRAPHVSDAVIAELNQQRAITRTVTEQAASLNGALNDFQAALSNTKFLSEQNRLLHEQLTRAESRLDELEAAQRVRLQPLDWENAEPATTNDLPMDSHSPADGSTVVSTAEPDRKH